MKNETLPALTGKNGHLADMTAEGFATPELEQEAKSVRAESL